MNPTDVQRLHRERHIVADSVSKSLQDGSKDAGVVYLTVIYILKVFCDSIEKQIADWKDECIRQKMQTEIAALTGHYFHTLEKLRENTHQKDDICKGSLLQSDGSYLRPSIKMFTYPVLGLNEFYEDIKKHPEMTTKERMKYELVRCSSFSKYPNQNVSSLRLSRAGFYYEGRDDEVTCFSCDLKWRNWRRGDNPLEIHRCHSPTCEFVNKQEVSELREGENDQEHKGVTPHKNGSQTEPNDSFLPRRSPLTCTSSPAVAETRAATEAAVAVTESAAVVANTTSSVAVQATSNGVDTTPYLANTASSVSESTPSLAGATSTVTEFRPNLVNMTSSMTESTQSSVTEDPSSDPSRRRNYTSTHHCNNSSRSQNAPVDTPPPTAAEALAPLGISIERPRYQRYAVLAVRLSTFQFWPRHKTQNVEELAKAGFMYEGTEDITKCFFCGGKLRDWEEGDDPWIEHARWFPECVYLRQCKGIDFVNKIVQLQNSESQDETQHSLDPLQLPAVRSVIEMGHSPDDVMRAFEKLSQQTDPVAPSTINAENLLQVVWQLAESPSTSTKDPEGATSHTESGSRGDDQVLVGNEDENGDFQSLLEENRKLKDQQMCKICFDEEISIVFLPCGHMATCGNCAPAMRRCPLCRKFIRGTVKAIMS